ncbi:hypothetical protein [Alkalihalobacillus sp. 1P02AB]|uniref:hypothetical protein n=1 Tax=Alkalihalobacillus sp. 1P02AB TaxID=3132260 RepID=UPI0039A66664
MSKVIGLFSMMFISMVLVACQSPNASELTTNELDEEANDEQLETNDNEATETEGTELTEEADSESATEENSDEDTVSDNESSKESSLPDSMEVGLQQSHPNGVNLTVETIHFDEEFITIDVTSINGHNYASDLSNLNRKGITLTDDTGFHYHFLPPEDNEKLTIEPDERLSGSLIFIGKLQEDAQSLTLTFNELAKGFEDSTGFPHPYFHFEEIEIIR